MPGLITEKIMEQMNRIGEPRVTTQESTLTAPQEGLDLGSMGLILTLLLGLGQGQAGGGLPGLPGPSDIATGLPPTTGLVGPTAGGAPPLVADGAPPINPQTLQMLMSMISGGGGRGF